MILNDIERAVIAKLCAGVEMPDFYEVLRQGYPNDAGERFVCLTKDDSLPMADIIEPLFKTAIAAARVKALEDAATLAEHENAADWSVSGRQIARQIRALKGGAAETVGGLAKAVKAARGGDAPPAPMRGFA